MFKTLNYACMSLPSPSDPLFPLWQGEWNPLNASLLTFALVLPMLTVFMVIAPLFIRELVYIHTLIHFVS